MKFAYFNIAAVCLSILLVGCESKKPTLEYMPHMMDSVAVKAQEPGSMRVPPAGTISQTTEIYPYANDAEGSSKFANPVPKTKVNLLKGQKLYNTYCIVCHGVKGEGNGNVVPKFPMPPSLHSDKVRGWADGRIFHVITMGQNLMPSYSSQLNPSERWAVINYVRVLQRALNPTESDLREYESAKAGR